MIYSFEPGWAGRLNGTSLYLYAPRIDTRAMAMRRRPRLHHRIVIPFVLVAILTTATAAYVAVSVVSRTLESRVETQILNASALVSQSDFALNAAILRSVKAIAGADVVTYTRGGAILAATFDPQQRPALISALVASDETSQRLSSADSAPILRRMGCDVPCYVAYQRVAARPGAIVAVVADTAELTAATRAITRTILLAAVLGLIVMVLVSQTVAQYVTAPLDQLVGFAREVSSGAVQRRAPTGDDEIGRLGRAFNDMLDRLDRSQSALVRSEKLALAGLLAARVAHDIRNPLSSIKMQTQLLRAQTRGDAQSQSIVAAVLHDVDTMESVILGLLELARPGDLKRTQTQLNGVVREVLQQLAPQLAHRKIGVDVTLDDTLPAIPLDAGRFRQALLNVIVNAADAMTTGGTLAVATRRSSDGSTIELDVCDDGIGVDPALLDRVFDPFVSTKRDGIGLGLVNTKAVVEYHGGRIELLPRVPRGTRATIWLPVHEVAHG